MLDACVIRVFVLCDILINDFNFRWVSIDDFRDYWIMVILYPYLVYQGNPDNGIWMYGLNITTGLLAG